ncbi:MAG TPA: OmpH family outer membrane protein [Oligoflexia bacterium]|nr:OmpH family outer membrane protein [Oligoflexia bacterium]HMP27400.1 OmpH family outer membrane protein [Oligoflexia bacterium]
MKRIFSLQALAILCIYLLWSGVSVSLAEFKVATVDINRVLNEINEAKEKKKELDQLSQKALKNMEAKRKELQATEQKIKEGIIQEGSKEAEKFKNDARNFARSVKDTEEDLRGKFKNFNNLLTDKVIKVVQNFAKDKSLDLVVDKSEGVRGPVIYGNTSLDITNEVIAKLNS